MAVYSVEGKLGTGKTKFCVWRAQQAFLEGRPVASNVDLKPWLLAPSKHNRYIRIPDKPTADDLHAMGHGNPDSYDEDRNGVLILDELGTWLNSRNFQDKGRMPLIDWFIHARKLGWDVYLIVQDSSMIDKQVRDSMIEYQAKCLRMDKVKIPIVGGFLSNIHKPLGYLPKFHLVAARVGEGANKFVAERWTFRGLELHAAYDTRQVFTADYPHGAHSVLPPWDFKRPTTWFSRLKEKIFLKPVPIKVIKPKPKPKALQLIASLPDLDERVRLTQRWNVGRGYQDVTVSRWLPVPPANSTSQCTPCRSTG